MKIKNIRQVANEAIFEFAWAVFIFFSLLHSAVAKNDAADWSDKPAKEPQGWVSPPSDSDQSGFSGQWQFAPPEPDADYDPRLDPKHPLKNPHEDPGKQWEGSHGKGLNNTFVGKGEGDWDWGEQYYGGVFYPEIKVTNGCSNPQPVTFFVEGLPYLTMPETMMVPPGDTIVKGSVKLPDEPPPPLMTGAPGEQANWGHVKFPGFVVPAGQFPPPQLHQPNFAKIEGEVVAWHPWSATADCNAARDTYTVTGHIHFRPPKDEGEGGGPNEIFKADACEVFWKIGERPPQLEEGKDCTERFKELAILFGTGQVRDYMLNSPEDWLWMPSQEELSTMTADELLAVKAKADVTMGFEPKGEASNAATKVGSASTQQHIDQNALNILGTRIGKKSGQKFPKSSSSNSNQNDSSQQPGLETPPARSISNSSSAQSDNNISRGSSHQRESLKPGLESLPAITNSSGGRAGSWGDAEPPPAIIKGGQ